MKAYTDLRIKCLKSLYFEEEEFPGERYQLCFVFIYSSRHASKGQALLIDLPMIIMKQLNFNA